MPIPFGPNQAMRLRWALRYFTVRLPETKSGAGEAFSRIK
jgi:hypothetical protein